MTPPSRRTTIAQLRSRSNPSLIWHVSCIVLGGGCLYTAPVWREPVDLAPEILLPETDGVTPLVLTFQAAVETVTVVAQDPEEEPLLFVWQIPHGVDFQSTEFEEDGGVSVGVLDVNRDPILDGAELTVTVFDPVGNAAEVRWLAEVP
jgi:hypothetical protein